MLNYAGPFERFDILGYNIYVSSGYDSYACICLVYLCYCKLVLCIVEQHKLVFYWRSA